MRAKIIPVGPKTEIAKQAVFHHRAGFKQHILLIWDGDVPREEADNYLDQAIESFKEAAGSKESFRQRLNKGFLPGQDAPERWGLSVRTAEKGMSYWHPT